MINLSKRVVAAPQMLSAPADREMVFLSIGAGKYYGLDDVGATIWNVLLESDSIALAIDRLLEEFEVDRETLERDVVELVERMIEREIAVLR